jgi:cob(I)alamin adenosyltransferase
MKIYTKTGDDGTTSLFSGGRVGKDHPRIEAYGTLDELNAILGLLGCEPLPEGTTAKIRAIQGGLFVVGGALADAENGGSLEGMPVGMEDLEGWIDEMDGELPELKAFIMPGGSRAAGLAHLARTVCRRAERRVQDLVTRGESLDERVLPFLNRLSDYFFELARWINNRMGIADPEWRP